jgi:hypothetical protein
MRSKIAYFRRHKVYFLRSLAVEKNFSYYSVAAPPLNLFHLLIIKQITAYALW